MLLWRLSLESFKDLSALADPGIVGALLGFTRSGVALTPSGLCSPRPSRSCHRPLKARPLSTHFEPFGPLAPDVRTGRSASAPNAVAIRCFSDLLKRTSRRHLLPVSIWPYPARQVQVDQTGSQHSRGAERRCQNGRDAYYAAHSMNAKRGLKECYDAALAHVMAA